VGGKDKPPLYDLKAPTNKHYNAVIFDGSAFRNTEMSRHNGTNSTKKEIIIFSPITPFILLDSD